MNHTLPFASDYMEGCHPNILRRLSETNHQPSAGYGLDDISDSARKRIRKACAAPQAEVKFLVGGTQTNATVIDCVLRPYEGVIAADSGHVNVHEAGAIEWGGHKVLALPSEEGKLTAEAIDHYVSDFFADDNWEHMVHPGMVYISQPTEWGTLYSKKELTDISAVCRRHHLPLFIDGARLAYALGSAANDVTLEDLARLADVFYIGGTKCGALLAKGWLLGIQFDELFKDDLYVQMGRTADLYAEEIKKALTAKGIPLYFDSPTNQIFFTIENSRMEKLKETVAFGFGCKADDSHSIIRLCTSWASQKEDVEKLIRIINAL